MTEMTNLRKKKQKETLLICLVRPWIAIQTTLNASSDKLV